MSPIEQLAEAVFNEGRYPQWHGSVMSRHEQEWPALWRAIWRIIHEELPLDRIRQDDVPVDVASEAYKRWLEERQTRQMVAMAHAMDKIAEAAELSNRTSVVGLLADARDLLKVHVPAQERSA